MSSNKRKRSEEAPVLTSCDWVRGRLLGQGGFGTVFLASLKKKPKLEETYPSIMAVKSAVISFDIELRREKFYLDLFSDCPFVIDCYGDDDSSVDSRSNMIYDVFLEYANGGSLAGLIQKFGKFGLPETLVRIYTQQILRGLKFIHEKRCVHCDLKPENILLVGSGSNSIASNFVAKIADLGLTKRAMRRASRNGTPKYMAPETAGFDVQEQYSDIWALGCIVVEMLTGRHLWNVKPGTSRKHLLNMIASQEPHIPTGLSKDATDFLVNCLHRYPSARPTASELLKHPFILQHCHCELCERDREVEAEALKLKQQASQSKVHCEEIEEVGCQDYIPLGSSSGQADADVEEEALNLITPSAPAVIPDSTTPVSAPIDSRPPVRAWDIICGG